MAQQIVRCLRRFGLFQISRAGYKLMPVSQKSTHDQRRVLEFSHPKSHVDALGDLINYPFGDEYLRPDVRVRRLKCAD
jgi:hypothetical protein